MTTKKKRLPYNMIADITSILNEGGFKVSRSTVRDILNKKSEGYSETTKIIINIAKVNYLKMKKENMDSLKFTLHNSK